MQQALKIAVVEDDAVTRKRFVDALAAAENMTVAKDCGTGREMLAWLERNQPDVLLVDLGLPDIPGHTVISDCAQRYPSCDIMVISMFGSEPHVLQSIESGASGYLLKDSMGEEIVQFVRELAAGGAPMSPVIARQVLKRFRAREHAPAPAAVVPAPAGVPSALSAREIEVIDLIARGFSYAEAAQLLKVSTHTVHFHIKNIYGKLSVHSKTEAVYEAQRLGLLGAVN